MLVTTREAVNWFSLNLILESCNKPCRHDPFVVKRRTVINEMLHKDLYAVRAGISSVTLFYITACFVEREIFWKKLWLETDKPGDFENEVTQCNFVTLFNVYYHGKQPCVPFYFLKSPLLRCHLLFVLNGSSLAWIFRTSRRLVSSGNYETSSRITSIYCGPATVLVLLINTLFLRYNQRKVISHE
jgi:hypothetical protein